MTEDQRPPVFELHIRPMFRLLDREHMLTFVDPGFDLWDLENVWTMRNDILVRLRGEGSVNMPGEKVGGPWPAEWIDLFERWTQNPNADDIGHHLLLGQRDGDYQVEPVADKRRLRARVTAPSPRCRAWFALESVTPGRREYTLYVEPPLPAPAAAPTAIPAVEMFDKGDVTRLVIHDAAGTQELPAG
jgi:hypothetical protein